jgi:hypothetical protein
MEVLVLDWLAQALQMPDVFHSKSNVGGGVIQVCTSSPRTIALLILLYRTQQVTVPL